MTGSATKRSNSHFCYSMDCFAALAMTILRPSSREPNLSSHPHFDQARPLLRHRFRKCCDEFISRGDRAAGNAHALGERDEVERRTVDLQHVLGALAGLAGFCLAVKDGAVNPDLLAWNQSGTVLLMVILGGIGSLRGAVIGACAFVLLTELFQSEALFGPMAAHWQLSLGIAIIAFVALLPKGLIGLAARLRGIGRG